MIMDVGLRQYAHICVCVLGTQSTVDTCKLSKSWQCDPTHPSRWRINWIKLLLMLAEHARNQFKPNISFCKTNFR